MTLMKQVSCESRVSFLRTIILNGFSVDFKLASSLSASLQLVNGPWLFEREQGENIYVK